MVPLLSVTVTSSACIPLPPHFCGLDFGLCLSLPAALAH